MYHFDNGHIYNCIKCRHVGITPGCIFHKDYVPSENNYPCDVNGNPIKSTRKEELRAEAKRKLADEGKGDLGYE